MAMNAHRLLFVYDTYDSDNKSQAEDRFSDDDDVWAIGADSRESVQRQLDWCVRQKMTFESALFQTHGMPGNIRFGDSYIGANNVDDPQARFSLSSRGYHSLFPDRGKIYFDGCNVGADDSGTNFLTNFGQVFLKNRGGVTMAYTNPGYGMEGWVPIIGGHTLHFFGSLKEIYFAPGGIVVPGPVVHENLKSYVQPRRV